MSISIANNNISSSGTLTLNNKALANVAFSGSYNDLSDKPNLGSGELLTDSWNDGSGNWYKVYQNGWIEQGGRFNRGGYGYTDVTFHKPFTTVPLWIDCAHGGDHRAARPNYASTTKMNTGYESDTMWIACGF